MFAYVIRRLLISIVVLFFATILVFLLVASSGNPLALLEANPHVPHSTIVARENLLHLNDPLWQRYWIWLTNALHGNLGTTINGQDVASQAMSHLFVTLRMVIIATVVAVVIAITLGVIAAVRQGKPADHVITVTNFVLLATPVFVLGLALKEFVAIPINQHVGSTIFYTNGEQSPTLSGSFLSRLPDYAAHTALPVLTLILVSYTSWAIYQRSSMIETLDADYVRLARSKGLRPRRVLVRHVLRNALIPVTTVVALDFAAVLGGAILTEIVFGWQGLGQWYVGGVTTLDVNVMLAYLLITATFVILFNLVADILYGVLDPRIRYA
ncbi:MAG TPA: ABC transporter permease [Acidimicrobiales bacterium]|jgi:peptide/nickel transport system permease protein|nr:ABC transporter permease [Acidimicrobiales bacterium]